MTNHLKFYFKATECNGWPNARIIVDNDILQDFTVDDINTSASIDIDYLDGDHILEIERYGKTNNNIVLKDGEILQDQSIELVSIHYNNIILPDYFLYHGVFHWNNQAYPSTVHWGPNGRWVWPFSMPFVTWAIDSLGDRGHLDLITPNLNNIESLQFKIQNLKSLWK